MNRFFKLLLVVGLAFSLTNCSKDNDEVEASFPQNEFCGNWWKLSSEKTNGVDTYAKNICKDFCIAFGRNTSDSAVYFKWDVSHDLSCTDNGIYSFVKKSGVVNLKISPAFLREASQITLTSMDGTKATGWYNKSTGEKVEVTMTKLEALAEVKQFNYKALVGGYWKMTAQLTDGVDSYAALSDDDKNTLWRFADNKNVYIKRPSMTSDNLAFGISDVILGENRIVFSGYPSIGNSEFTFTKQSSTSFSGYYTSGNSLISKTFTKQ